MLWISSLNNNKIKHFERILIPWEQVIICIKCHINIKLLVIRDLYKQMYCKRILFIKANILSKSGARAQVSAKLLTLPREIRLGRSVLCSSVQKRKHKRVFIFQKHENFLKQYNGTFHQA